MYNSFKVIVGIIVFGLFFGVPFWLNFGRAKPLPKPELPTDSKECVESREYMRAYHMKMLLDWRDKKVREGMIYYTNSQGKVFKMSLQNTCLKCHKGMDFCDECHSTVSARPDCRRCHVHSLDPPECWNCHTPPEEGKNGNK